MRILEDLAVLLEGKTGLDVEDTKKYRAEHKRGKYGAVYYNGDSGHLNVDGTLIRVKYKEGGGKFYIWVGYSYVVKGVSSYDRAVEMAANAVLERLPQAKADEAEEASRKARARRGEQAQKRVWAIGLQVHRYELSDELTHTVWLQANVPLDITEEGVLAMKSLEEECLAKVREWEKKYGG